MDSSNTPDSQQSSQQPPQQQQQQQPPPQQQQPPPPQPPPPQQQQPQQQQLPPPPPQQQQQQQQQPHPHQPHPHPMHYHQVHNQQHAPHPMAQNPYMQYPQAPHPHYYPHHQQMQPPPPHQSPYAVSQAHHAAGPPPPMGPHPQAHQQQPGPMYSPHPPPHPHPQSHQPPHWVHGPHQQQPPPHPQHPQQHMMQHPSQQPPHGPPQPAYYQHPSQAPHATPGPPQQQLPPPPPQSHQPHQPQPHPMQYHQVHSQQQHTPHPMAPNPYMQYPQAHPHYYPHHQQMQPPPPHQSPYAVSQPPHASGPPPMGPHPQAHPQQPGPMYSPHPPPHMHPQSHQPPPHWVHGPHQQPPPPHPQQHIMQHPPQQLPHAPQPGYYPPPPPQQQPHSATGMLPHPSQQQPPQQQQPMPQQLPPPASPHHPPSRTHTPQQHPPNSQTPTRIPPPSSTPSSPSPNIPTQGGQGAGGGATAAAAQAQAQAQAQAVAAAQAAATAAATASVHAAAAVKEKEKKEITFPKNSVEATKVVASKKRKFTSKDVTDIEVWRLLMCLKSGLLAESSWAIDVLSILLNDDSTLMHFGLQHMPGLLESVLEHLKCCLNELFGGLVNDTIMKPTWKEVKPTMEYKHSIKKENGVSNDNNNTISANNNNINGVNNDSKALKSVINKKKVNGIAESPSYTIPNSTDQIIMFNTAKNFTYRTRDGKIVKWKNGTVPAQETSYELVFKPVGYSHWQEGNGEDTSHIQVYFEPKSFIESSGNDVEMSKHAGLLLVLGRLLLLKHDDVVHNEADTAPSEWSLLSSLREDTLVIISNISSSLDLSPYNDKINLSLLDGLLHWACCSSSYALDPFPYPSMTVSPQRLALESLAKLSIIEGNVDLVLATPPWSRIEQLFEVLARLLNINEDQTIREFSLVLLSNLTSADSGIARKVALTGAAIPRLLSFLETSLADPETYATTQDMLRRAAITLKCLSQLVDNHPLFAQHQQRLLNLVMSQKLDQEVVPIIADVIFEISLSD